MGHSHQKWFAANSGSLADWCPLVMTDRELYLRRRDGAGAGGLP